VGSSCSYFVVVCADLPQVLFSTQAAAQHIQQPGLLGCRVQPRQHTGWLCHCRLGAAPQCWSSSCGWLTHIKAAVSPGPTNKACCSNRQLCAARLNAVLMLSVSHIRTTQLWWVSHAARWQHLVHASQNVQRVMCCCVCHRPVAGAHDSWRVAWGSALSPRRCGSPPSTRNVALQQQQQWHGGSPKSVRSAGSDQRGYSSGKGSPQRPRSPGAAGLLDAAAVVAAEMEAEREEASRMSSRLRFAEDKLLQQVWLAWENTG
jgi:hypothetical protein